MEFLPLLNTQFNILISYINTLPTPFLLGVFFFVVLCIGSHLSVVMVRTQIKERFCFLSAVESELGDSQKAKDELNEASLLNSPRSCCPSCRKQLAWYHNIPVLSFIALKGKCAFCKDSISLQYPAVELFTALVCTFSFMHIFKSTITIESMLFMGVLLIGTVIVVIDLKSKFVLDDHSKIYCILSILFICTSGKIDMQYFLHLIAWATVIMTTTAIIVYWIACASTSLTGVKLQTMGEGDNPLIFVSAMLLVYFSKLEMAAFTDLILMLILIVLSTSFASFFLTKLITKKYSAEVPFAPSLIAVNCYMLIALYLG